MADVFGPFNVAPRIVQRSTNFVDLIARNRPGTDQYRLWGSPTVDDAYGNLAGSGVGGAGPSEMLTVFRDRMAQSISVIRRGWRVEESRRGQSSFQFDPDDFLDPTLTAPFNGDAYPMFVRVQEYRGGQWLAVPLGVPLNPGTPILGPILLVPPVDFYGRMGTAVITLQGIAPAGTGCTPGAFPVIDATLQTPLPMHILLPKVSSFKLTALAAGNNLLFASNLHDSMIQVNPDAPLQFDDSLHGLSELVLAAEGAAASFSFTAVSRIAS